MVGDKVPSMTSHLVGQPWGPREDPLVTAHPPAPCPISFFKRHVSPVPPEQKSQAQTGVQGTAPAETGWGRIKQALPPNRQDISA